MSKYRPVYKKIWKDKDFKESCKDSKLLFLYLTTNESINNSGIYEMPISIIAYETSITKNKIKKLLINNNIKNILYDITNEIVFVVNARKYFPGGNPAQVEKGIISEFKETCKTFLWLEFLKLNPQFNDKFPTLDQPLPNGSLPLPLPLPLEDLKLKKEPLKIEKKNEEAIEILTYLNEKAKKRFEPTSTNLGFIKARMSEGYPKKAFFYAIDCKVEEWGGSQKWDKFLRPKTLFNAQNFEGYANQILTGKRTIEIKEPEAVVERAPPSPELQSLWDKFIEKIKEQILPESFETWFKFLFPMTFEDDLLRIAVPNQFTRKAMIENYRTLIEKILKDIMQTQILVEFSICKGV